MVAIIYRNLRLAKLSQISNLIQTKQTFGSIIFKCICGSKDCSTTFSPFFSFWKVKFVFLDSMSFSLLSNLAMWFVSNTVRYRLYDICMLSRRFWAHIHDFFLCESCKTGLLLQHKLRASSLKQKESCLHHLQILFVEDDIVRRLHFHNVSFWKPIFCLLRDSLFFLCCAILQIVNRLYGNYSC